MTSRPVSRTLWPFFNAGFHSAMQHSFGMLQVGRNLNSPEYKYSFNGKLKDDEVKGSGNSIDFDARIYDARIGRFLTVDPLIMNFPWWSPYQYAGNTPIQAFDLDGLETAFTNYLDKKHATVEGAREVSSNPKQKLALLAGALVVGTLPWTIPYLAQYGTAGLVYTTTVGAPVINQIIRNPQMFTEAGAFALELFNPTPQDLCPTCKGDELAKGFKLVIVKLGDELFPKIAKQLSGKIDDTLKSSKRIEKGRQQEEGARAISKKLGHAEAGGYKSVFEGIKPTQKNAEKLITDILKNPAETQVGEKVIDIYNEIGQGIRLEKGTGKFIGFIEKQREKKSN